MIEPSRHPQLSFAEGLIQDEVGPLWEEWMRQVDTVLADFELVQIVYQALARRWPQSRTRDRPGTPAEVVLRLLLLKHMRNWSYHVLEREVRANLVYRQFTRVGAQKVPDAKTLGRLAVALGPEIIEQIHRRVVAIACVSGKLCAQAVARGYHSGGDRHSLPDRQLAARRRLAIAGLCAGVGLSACTTFGCGTYAAASRLGKVAGQGVPTCRAIGEALVPMGFAGGMGSGAHICIYAIWGAVLPHQRIDIKYDPQSNIIVILDYNNISATRLDREIVEHISATFKSVYGVRVRFGELPRSLARCLGP